MYLRQLFWAKMFGIDFTRDTEPKYSVHVHKPSLSGEFAEAGVVGRETEQRIYASPDTTKALAEIHPNLMTVTAEIANADHVIFLSKDDIKPEILKADQSHGVEGTFHGEDYEYYGEAFDSFRRKFEDPPRIIVSSAALAAYNNGASSMFHVHEGQSYSVITLPDMEQDAAATFKTMAGLKSIMLDPSGEEYVRTKVNVPESEALNKAVIASGLLHEAGHSAYRHGAVADDTAITINNENQADDVSAAATPILFPEVGEEVVKLRQGARAIGAMLSKKVGHATNLDLHNDKSVTPDQQYDAIKAVREAVVVQIEKDVGTDRSEAESLLRQDPQLIHATINKLDQMGAFDDDPVAQKYVSDYMEAGAECAPEYLGVNVEGEAPAQREDSSLPSPEAENITVPPMPSM